MTNYQSCTEKFCFSPRMEQVYTQILARLRDNRTREGTDTCPISAPDCDPMYEVFRDHPDMPYVIVLAHAIVRTWMVTPPTIFPWEMLVGITRPMYPHMEHFSWGIHVNYPEEPTDAADKPAWEAHCAVLRRMEPMNGSHMFEAAKQFLPPEPLEALLQDNMFGAGGYQGHTVPGYPLLLSHGLDGMLAHIDALEAQNGCNPDTRDFYEANRIIIRGMSAWLQMYADRAEALAAAEPDGKQKRWYTDIAANCAHAAHKKPETLYQAAQLVWCLSLWDWVDCVGRMDQYLWPFYEQEVQRGNSAFADELITSLVFKIWENGSHNVTLSGVSPEDGKDATNTLTYLLLQILRTIHDTHPRMSVRIHEHTAQELWNLILQMWQEGMSDPTLVSDTNVIAGLCEIGVPLQDARDYTMLGCQEIEIPGKSNFGCEDGKMNLAKVLEYAMQNGRSTTHPDIQVGPEVGEFVDFADFEDFYHAYTVQLEFFTDIFINLCNRGQEIRAGNFAKLVKTPFTVGCLEKGLPHDAGGPLYNFGVVETAGLAVVADALTAIKKLVYEEKKIDRQTLMDALDADFVGYEPIRQMLLHQAPKFGNDDTAADAMACRVLDQFWTLIGTYKSVRGDVFTGACSLLEDGIWYGKCTGATADGRHAGEPLGNSMGPRPGVDREGLSAMLSSVAKLPLQKGVGGTTLNVTLNGSLLDAPHRRDAVGAALRTYMQNGGQMAQITTARLSDLLDARKHPEAHGDLIVRIGGFSIQFVQLCDEAQLEIISRYTE